MATFAWLSLLFLAFSPLKEVLCKECTNIPSSSHTLRQAGLSSPKLSAESMDLYPYYNPYGASQSAENPRSHSDQSALYASSLVSEENPFADRVFSGFLQLKSVAQESAEAMDSAKDSFLYGGAEAMNSAKYSFLYGGNAQLEAISEANVMSMELDKYQFAGRKVMRPYAYADKVASESGEDLAQKKPFLQEVSLHDVFLDPDSMQAIAQQTNLEYLLMLDVDNLVWSFRNLSGLSAAGSPYGGWESPTSELRGHFVGHYMSATAHMWASTHSKTLYDKMTMVVDALSECQQKIGNGYLSAFPSEFFDRFEAIEPVWAPYYTIHKIMAGLLDQYTFAGNTKALKMAEDMADYFDHRVSKVIDLYTIERHWESLNEETGGMNDVLYRLYTLTKDPKYLKLAHLFDKPCFLGLLAVQADSLSGFHANTHIPVVIGAQMRFEITSDRLYKDMSSFFTDIVSTSHSYPTGGTSAGEFWTDPLHLGDTLSTTETEESCTTYNMLKVARHLFRWTKQMKYADYYERALTNGVLSIQRGQEPGVMIYMLPMGKGQSKAISYHGWGTKFESFWCCYGTGIESFSKLGDSIYFEEARGENTSLYIIQLVSSSLAWKSIGLLLQQRVEALSSSNPILHVSFEFSEINNTLRGPNTDMGTSATLQIRIPFWVESSSANASLNNEKLLVPLTPGEFLQIQHTWQVGDKLELFLNPLLRVEKVKDSRDTYSSLYAIFFGPYLLAGKSDGDWDITGVDLQSLTKWVTPIEDKDRKMLYSFTQESTSGQGVVFLTHQHSGLSMGRCPLEGTNEAMHATFKLVDPVATKLMSEDCLDALLKGMGRIVKGLLKHKSKGSSNKDVVGELVAIEQFDQPGSFLMHEDDARVKFARSNVRQHDGRVCENSNRVFRVVPGLHAPKDYVSFEAVSRPGCFLYTDHDDVRAIVKLGCIALHKDTRFRKAASFLIHPQPLASYPSISFTAKGTNKEYPVFPLIGFKDETYTVFFNITR